MPKYPKIKVQLSGQDGDAFYIISRVRKALRMANVDAAEVQKFNEDAQAGDYNNMLRVMMQWVDVA